MLEKLKSIKDRYDVVCEKLVSPDILSNNKEYVNLCKEQKNLEPLVDKYNEYKKVKEDLIAAEEMAQIETGEMKEFLEAEILENKEKILKLDDEIKILLLPKDENDDKNVIIEIRAGAGGDEAALFGAEVMRMYLKFAEKKRFKVEVYELNDTELGGVKDATFKISGNGAYARFKFESGVHRVQRVPDTETQGRVHTSTITVAVLPEVEDVEFELDEKELKIDTCRASGAGGQHINKTESAIRVTHLPTGIVVYCQDQRSQVQNKETALRILKTKLYDKYKTEQDEKYAENRRTQIGTGDRSERIRTYNYPQGRLTDHRINYTVYALTEFLNGDIEELIEQLTIADQRAKLEKGIDEI
ncbi:MAG: peptide chain release factor 1 [Clostridiales bacterium]|nr:peptide chain release factor 1 [Clostridiales bacterium]